MKNHFQKLPANIKNITLTINISIAFALFTQGCSFIETTSDIEQASKPQPYVQQNHLPQHTQQAIKPNIVVILADDLGYGDLGVYNRDSKIPTPNMDAIAKQGIRFTDAHTPSAVCTPTRYGLLTGRYAWRSRLKRGVLFGESPALIEQGRMTIQSMLQDKGYITAGIGKWHLGLGSGLGNNGKTDYSQALNPGPVSSGFDYYFGIPASLDMPPYLYFENEKVVQAPTAQVSRGKLARYGGKGFWREGAIAPDFSHLEVLPTLANKAEAYIAERGKQPQQPFFLYMPLPSPHTPWIPKAEFVGKSNAGVYGDFVYQSDDVIGRIMKALKDNGLADNTLVIVTSDNGSHWKTTDIEEFNHLANAHWRGMKADIYEGGHRVPFIASWPKNIPAGSVSDENLSLVDLLATFAAIVDSDLPDNAGEDSYNQLATLMGDKTQHNVREATVYHAVGGMFAIQQGPWKYIKGQTSGGFGSKAQRRKLLKENPNLPAGQLYNLATDPGETTNLFLEKPEKVALLKALLKRYQEQGYSRPRSVDDKSINKEVVDEKSINDESINKKSVNQQLTNKEAN
ncbi:sulfatase family protein [Colwellia piezophila]|uniref:sulfatase family protein n=1 Tax=Colwellia piezophila TaxID=211668 RepID=UPI00037957B9|nr:arylsulfatase [Colwellia piezophila]